MMEAGYKFTTADHTTYGGCGWGPNVTHETDGGGPLCGPGWLHYYSDPLVAVMHNPIDGDYPYDSPLWECRIEGATLSDHGMKNGCSRLTTLRIIKTPRVELHHRVAYGILCVLEVYWDPSFRSWANSWLSGKDRSASSAGAELERLAQSGLGFTAARAAWLTAWAAEAPASPASPASIAAARAAMAASAALDYAALARAAIRVEGNW